ncbi:MAG: S1C family serine protease [Pyrinomonadaceae bacterium]
MKTNFVLLVIAFAAMALPAAPQTAADTANVSFRVVLIDADLDLKPVPKFALAIRKADPPGGELRSIATSFEGTAAAKLEPGEYVVSSVRPVVFGGRSYGWEVRFTVAAGKDLSVELSSDNASSAPETPRRRVTEEGELFKTLRDGVVTVEGELTSGTGFIFDARGLVLTNQHVINKSNDIRVRFDRRTAVRARLVAQDVDRDISVLQVNLSAFPASRVLAIAQGDRGETLVEGEHVFAIGSPLRQDKILTAGIVSKIEERGIISDISINAGSSGGPLFNSLGEVVGITTFQARDKDETGPGIGVVIRIEEAAELMARSREIAAAKGLPSAELMPSAPDGVFPVETIRAALERSDFPVKEYITDVKNYEIKFMTPIYKFYEIHRERMEALRSREKRNSKRGAIDAPDKLKDLHYWQEYAGELRPVVDILALPEITATGKSIFLQIATSATTGYSTPLDLKYKADFYQMKLMCDGSEIVPISRSKIELNRSLQSYYKTKKRYTFAGVYSYPYEVFAPGRCGRLEVQVFSEEDIETPIVAPVDAVRRSRVWQDFEDFRRQTIGSAAPPTR